MKALQLIPLIWKLKFLGAKFMMSKGAMGNLINKYRAVLKKCHLLNVFGSLAMAGTLVATGAIAASATEYSAMNHRRRNRI